MKKAAVMALLAVAIIVIAEGGKRGSVTSTVSDVHAEGEASEEDSQTSDRVSQIDTSISIEAGSRIAVVSKSTSGEFWNLVNKGMEDAVSDVNQAYGYTSKSDQITMTFEGASDEEDVEKQVNTLDAVIAENPAVLCLSASDVDSCQAQIEAAGENGIPVVVFDSNVSNDDQVTAFRGTDNEYVGKLAGEKLAEAIGGSGKVAIFAAQEKTESTVKRVEGFKEALEDYDDISIVSELYTDQVDDMSTSISDVLTSNSDLVGVFCSNGDVSDLYLSVEKSDTSPAMVGVDATTAQQSAIGDGTELGVVSQDPYEMGYQTIMAAIQAMAKSDDEDVSIEKSVLLEPKWIDSSNINDDDISNYLYTK